MHSLPRVTVITPSFNQAEYLEQTLHSVLNQGYPNLEYLVIDGASTDGSVEIIRRYANQLSGWVSEPDHGQGEAINKGFARASGEIVAWLNSDDLYLPGAINAAVRAFQNHPDIGMVFGDVVSMDGSGNPINVMTYGPWGLDDLLQFNIIGQPAVFIRRDVLEKAGFLDTSYHYLLDHQLWLRTAQRASTLYVHERWAAARYHANAKNVAHAAEFGEEAYRIAAWVKTQPELDESYRRLHRRIWAGAHRMNARYLLDGGQPRAALKAYMRSLGAYPPIALRESRRILYAAVSLIFNIEQVKQKYLQSRKDHLNL